MASRSSLVFQTHARASSSRDSGILTAPNNSPESHLKGWRLIVVICLLSGAAFTISLDDTVVATAIPRITDDFRSIADVSWYGSAYLLTMGGTQLLFGKLYALHIDKTIYIASMCIFAAGSTISATAPNSIVFIVGRAVAGVGAAGLMTGSFVICAHSTPLRMRPIYTGIVGSMTAVGSVLGPLLGGVITDNLSWRWIFWINLPIIGVLLILFVVFYHTTQPASSTRTPWRARIARYDLPGNFLFLSAVVCFQIALQWGGTQYPWQSKRVIILLVCSAVLLLAFVPLEKVLGEKATIPGRIASQRTVASSGVFMALLGAAYYSSIYNLPLWFQGVKGSSPTESGIMSVALLISMVVSALITGVLVSATGWYNPYAIAAPILAACGTGLLSTLEPDSSPMVYIGYQILLGIGIGCGFNQPFIAVQTVLNDMDTPIGLGLMMCAEMLGGAVGIAAAQKLFEDRLLTSMEEIAPEVTRSTILATGATGLTALVSDELRGALRKGFSDAVTTTFYLSSGLAAASLIAAFCLEWKSIKTAKKDTKRSAEEAEEDDERELKKMYRLSLGLTMSSFKM